VISSHAPKSERRRHTPGLIPPELQAKVREFAAELSEQHADAFEELEMKNRIAGLLRRCLPPRPRRPGRPGIANVTAAIRLLAELQRLNPARPAKEIWQQIYRRLIPRWDNLGRIERAPSSA